MRHARPGVRFILLARSVTKLEPQRHRHGGKARVDIQALEAGHPDAAQSRHSGDGARWPDSHNFATTNSCRGDRATGNGRTPMPLQVPGHLLLRDALTAADPRQRLTRPKPHPHLQLGHLSRPSHLHLAKIMTEVVR